MPLRASRLLCVGVSLAHLLPLACLLAPEVPWLARATTGGMVLLSAFLSLRRMAHWRHMRLVFSPQGLQLEDAGRNSFPLERLAWTALGPMRALRLEGRAAAPLHWVVLRDGFSAEEWRRFNVQLRWRADGVTTSQR